MSCFRMTSAMASRSFLSIMAPVGLLGKGSTRILVLSVMASSSSAAVSLNSFSSFRSMITGFAPAITAQGS